MTAREIKDFRRWRWIASLVDPHQYLGLEINERAVAIAELVLWRSRQGICNGTGDRTRGKVDPVEPILRDFKNIRHQDAALG